jgi:uncharacterized 2Fe-2S/4Fe-4S cluster protein (DUF4445 family)
MPTVRFVSGDSTVSAEVEPGTPLHDAAIRAGLHDLELPCGGKGTCGQCLVEAGEQLVMACQTRVTHDLTVRIRKGQDSALRVVGDSHFLVGEGLLPDRAALSPLAARRRLTVPPATVEEHYSDWKRLVSVLNCGLPVTASLSVLRALAAAVRGRDGRVTVSVQERGEQVRVTEIAAGHAARRTFGLAIDVGTTTVAAQIVDLDDGHVVSTATGYNLQIRRGSDVITRIDYARTAERLEELRGMVLETINGLVRQAPVDAQDVLAAFVAGNTTMIHLLLGLPPRHVREAPYVPTVNAVPTLSAREVGLAIGPDAVVEISPGVGSYVGGDITAGLLATEIPVDHERAFLFMDIGTNGEIVVGNADWMVGCACSAGPAFEGSGVQCGMRATEGAIEQIEIDEVGRARYRVIGDGRPEGICGSGLICLLGELLQRGIVDQSGRLVSGRAFVVARGSETVSGHDLVITDRDIENLIRTKAAIYAACALVLDNVGLQWDQVARVYIAGGFGRYIRIGDAVRIGMLPDLPHARFTYLGNSALTGAYIALLSRAHRQRLVALAARMTYLDLSSEPRYMDSYVKATFLPHTDLEQFPSVADALKNQRRDQA